MLKNKIIIPALLVFCTVINAQMLPVDVTEKPVIERNTLWTDYTLDFEMARNERINSFTADLYHLGKAEYEVGNFKAAKELLVEFIDSEIVGVDMNSEMMDAAITWIGVPYNKYRVYKYHACHMLKNIYYGEKNYKRSFYYYHSANKYRFGFRCGFTDGNMVI